MALAGPDDLLMQSFDFTADDLQLNRAGQISERQHTRLQAISHVDLAGLSGGVFVLGVVVLVLFGLCSWLFNLRVIIESQAPLFGGVAVVIVLVAGLMFYANWRGARERAQAGQVGTVETIEGTASLRVLQRGAKDLYFFKIAYEEFEISPSAFTHFQHTPAATRYRVYYHAESRQILSAEILH